MLPHFEWCGWSSSLSSMEKKKDFFNCCVSFQRFSLSLSPHERFVFFLLSLSSICKILRVFSFLVKLFISMARIPSPSRLLSCIRTRANSSSAALTSRRLGQQDQRYKYQQRVIANNNNNIDSHINYAPQIVNGNDFSLTRAWRGKISIFFFLLYSLSFRVFVFNAAFLVHFQPAFVCVFNFILSVLFIYLLRIVCSILVTMCFALNVSRRARRVMAVVAMVTTSKTRCGAFSCGWIFFRVLAVGNACVFKFDVFGLCFDPSRFVLMDQINSAGDIADYGDFM